MKKDSIYKEIDINGLSSEVQSYLNVHEKRYEYLLAGLEKLRKNFPDKSIRILDVGPSVFTRLLEKKFPADEIIAMGLVHNKSRGGHLPDSENLSAEKFYGFNLNDAQYRDKWLSLPSSDIIILAEVLEHLFTAPELVLSYLSSQLKESGYLVMQTPNGASLKNRIRMLLGRNPFEMIRENADNPGHFREYTLKELKWLAEKAGFRVYKIECRSYFNPRNVFEKIYMKITGILPRTFRDGITVILKK